MTILLHTCGAGPCEHDSAPLTSRIERQKSDVDRPFTVDVHCHVLIPELEARVTGHPGRIAETEALGRATGKESVTHNLKEMLPAAGIRMTSLAKRIEDMDALGIDVQVLSPSPSQYYYWAEPELAAELVEKGNRQIARLCAQHPRRLVGLANVALQHPQLAAEQLDFAVRELGLRGAEISSQVPPHDYDHPSFNPFWTKAEELGCLLFLHPFGSTLGERLNRHYLSNVIGQPLETTIALSHLICGGVLDRFPRLRICAAHGGGFLPFYPDRSDHAYRVRPEARGSTRPPSAYLKQIWFDTVVYGPLALRHLADQVGTSQIVMGTDYPFDMGSYRLHELIDAVPGLSTAERAGILGLNAAGLLGIDALRK